MQTWFVAGVSHVCYIKIKNKKKRQQLGPQPTGTAGFDIYSLNFVLRESHLQVSFLFVGALAFTGLLVALLGFYHFYPTTTHVSTM